MDERLESWPDPLSLCGKASKRHLPRITTRQMSSRQRAIIRVSSRVSKLWFPCIHVESTSLPRADNGITSFANIPVRLLSSLLPLLMHDGQSNQRGPCLPNVYTIRRLPIFIFSKRVFKIFLFPQTNNNETNLQIFLKKNKKLFHTKYIHRLSNIPNSLIIRFSI